MNVGHVQIMFQILNQIRLKEIFKLRHTYYLSNLALSKLFTKEYLLLFENNKIELPAIEKKIEQFKRGLT